MIIIMINYGRLCCKHDYWAPFETLTVKIAVYKDQITFAYAWRPGKRSEITNYLFCQIKNMVMLKVQFYIYKNILD